MIIESFLKLVKVEGVDVVKEKTKHGTVQLMECIQFAKEMNKLDEKEKQFIAGLVSGIIYSKKKSS